jgi:hypothetical protein
VRAGGKTAETGAGAAGTPPRRIVHNQAGGAWVMDTVRADTTLTIGRIEGEPEYLFGVVKGIAVDPAGHIYVADWQGGVVRAYGPDGSFLRQITATGDGPGETRSPTGLNVTPDGRLVVRDIRRLMVLQPRASGAVADSVVATWPLEFYTNWVSGERGRLDGTRYFYPYYSHRVDQPSRWFHLVLEAGDVGPDTLPVPTYATALGHRSASYRVSAGTGRMVAGVNVAPFEPVASWDITTRGTTLSGDGARYEIVETDLAGDTLLVFDRSTPNRVVSAAERADSLTALEARLDSIPVPLDRVEGMGARVRSRSLPDSTPAFLRVWAAEDGRVWVQRWPPEGRAAESFFDVFDDTGIFLGVVVVPGVFETDPVPLLLADAFYGVVKDPDTGVHRVVRAGFTEPEREPGAPAAVR